MQNHFVLVWGNFFEGCPVTLWKEGGGKRGREGIDGEGRGRGESPNGVLKGRDSETDSVTYLLTSILNWAFTKSSRLFVPFVTCSTLSHFQIIV